MNAFYSVGEGRHFVCKRGLGKMYKKGEWILWLLVG